LLELKSAIVRRGMEFRQFAAAMEWSPSYLSHVLAGRKRPSDDMWPRAAEILRFAEEELRPPREELPAA
jgi:transcriptional regulator with XRE-family HTH domain